MKRIYFLLTIILVLGMAAQAMALPMGAISTDRFGYTGVVKRYDSLADAQAGTSQVGEDIEIGNRDLSLYIVNGYNDYDVNQNIMMGSWWYSTEGQAGYGNTRGNSGRGFLQLYDEAGSTDTAVDMFFTNFDGTYWTEFQLSISGENANYDNAYARFWVDYLGPGSDVVKYHTYNLNLTAGGLLGLETDGWVEAENQPGSVTGVYSGIFENVSEDFPQNNGFYTFELNLDMVNWAWENREDLDPYEFSDSYFAASAATEPIPEPSTMLLLGSGLIGIFALARKKYIRK